MCSPTYWACTDEASKIWTERAIATVRKLASMVACLWATGEETQSSKDELRSVTVVVRGGGQAAKRKADDADKAEDADEANTKRRGEIGQ